MSDDFDSLSGIEVAKIGKLVEALEKSRFDYMTLEVADFRLTLAQAGVTPPADEGPRAEAPPPTARPTKDASTPQPSMAAAPAEPAAPTEEGLVDVLATTMGRFYPRPDPNSPPFVAVGAEVEADSAVGLIEVMKLFNTVNAGVAGVVAEICVADAELVEYGQVLMRIRPSA